MFSRFNIPVNNGLCMRVIQSAAKALKDIQDSARDFASIRDQLLRWDLLQTDSQEVKP
jgi:hypothetical protein